MAPRRKENICCCTWTALEQSSLVQITDLLQVLSCTLENACSQANTTAMLTPNVRLYLGTVVLFFLNTSCQDANLLTI